LSERHNKTEMSVPSLSQCDVGINSDNAIESGREIRKSKTRLTRGDV